jgi:hypothetical protein
MGMFRKLLQDALSFLDAVCALPGVMMDRSPAWIFGATFC